MISVSNSDSVDNAHTIFSILLLMQTPAGAGFLITNLNTLITNNIASLEYGHNITLK